MPADESTIETSSQAGIEVQPPLNNPVDDWASRLDSEIDTLNKETGASLHGKPDETGEKPKTSREVKKSGAEAETDKNVGEEKPGEGEEKPKEEAPKGLTEKAAVKWGELRAEAAQAKVLSKEVESLRAELERAKATVPNTAEIEHLRQVNQAYEQELSVARVEATQEYKSNVVSPMTDVVGFVGELAQRYELDQRSMLAAFSEPDPAKQSDLIADIAGSMSERDRLKFYATCDDYSEIIRRRDIYQNYSRERRTQLDAEYNSQVQNQQTEYARQATEAQSAHEAATEKVFGDLKRSISVLEDEEVATEVKRLAAGDYSNADPELKSYLSHSGAILPHLLKALKAAQAELGEANKKVLGYRNGSARAGSGSSENSHSLGNETGFLDAIESGLR